MASKGEIIFEGLRASYDNITDIQFSLRNLTDVPVNLDPYESDRVIVERWNLDRRTWEQGSRARCFYSYSDRPASVAPGETLEIRGSSLKAFHHDEERTLLIELADGESLPAPGRYRLRLRYSVQPWQPLVTPDSGEIEEVVSREFDVGGDR